MDPVFSIVTPALNCVKYLPRNRASIVAQGLKPNQYEHWVIDGGSTDGTVDWLRMQPGVKWISEKDRGLSHAVNKGIARSTGQWIIWLNADDELAPGALQAFLDVKPAYPGTYLFCGAQKVFGYDGTLEATAEGWDYVPEQLLGLRTAILQASTFVQRSVYDKVGLLDESYRYAMDYEWTVRAAHQFKCQPLPCVLTHYHRRRGSIMDHGIANQHREFLRVRRAWKQGRLTPAEFRLRFYLATEPFRRIRWLRLSIRKIKNLAGCKSTHPLMGPNTG